MLAEWLGVPHSKSSQIIVETTQSWPTNSVKLKDEHKISLCLHSYSFQAERYIHKHNHRIATWPIDLVRHRNSAILSIPTLCIEDRLVYLQPHSLNGSNNVGQYRECKLDQSKHFMMEVYLGTSPQSRVPVFGWWMGPLRIRMKTETGHPDC